jgi:hypothetical protein
MDLTLVPELTTSRLPETKQRIADHGLRVICLGAGARCRHRDAKNESAMRVS